MDLIKKQEEPREIRVFISSTFQDLHEERDYLIRRIFPRLAGLCRERDVVFTGVDLRWGITEEEAQQGRTIRLCLDEIQKCKPYFICILGHRYGWVPEAEELLKDQDLGERYETVIREAVNNRISITEMEILQGVFRQPGEVNALFYFEDKKYFEEKNKYLKIEEDLQRKEKLQALKDSIKKSDYPVRENFISKEMLGEWVYEDIKKTLDERFPIKEAQTEEEQQYKKHLELASSRKAYYLKNNEAYAALNSYAEKGTMPLVVWGKSGLGKTALLANWAGEYQENHPETLVVQYYGGAASEMTDIDVMLYILQQIKEKTTDFQVEIPTDPQELRIRFHDLLQSVKKKVVIIIDALNQLDSKAQELNWVPEKLPGNMKLIISTIDNGIIKEIRERKWLEYPIKPLSKQQMKEMIIDFLKLHGKSITQQQIEEIVDFQGEVEEKKVSFLSRFSQRKSYGNINNPLFLKTFLIELLLTGRYDNLQEKINHYLSAADLEALFHKVLERMEEDFGSQLIGFLLGSICFSRNGLSEEELKHLAHQEGIKYLDIVDCLHGLDFHLMKKGQLLDFFHDYIRQSVVKKYFSQEGQEEACRRRLVDFFSQGTVLSRQAEEVPYQYYQLKDWEALEKTVLQQEIFQELSHHHMYELLQYFQQLQEEKGDLYDKLMNSLETEGLFHKALGKKELQFFKSVASLFHLNREFEKARKIYAHIFHIDQEKYGEGHPKTQKSFTMYLKLLLKEGNYDLGLALAEKELKKQLEASGDSGLGAARAYHNLAFAEMQAEKWMEAIESCSKALEIKKSHYGDFHPKTAEAMEMLAIAINSLMRRWKKSEEEKRFDKEETDQFLQEFQEKRLEIKKHYLDSKDLPWIKRHAAAFFYEMKYSFGQIGDIFKGNTERQGRLLKEALEIKKLTLGRLHPAVADSYIHLAMNHGGWFNSKARIKHFKKALQIRENFYGSYHPEVANVLHHLGDVSKTKEAISYFRRAWQIQKKVYGSSHPATVNSAKKLSFSLRGTLSFSNDLEADYIDKSLQQQISADGQLQENPMELPEHLVNLNEMKSGGWKPALYVFLLLVIMNAIGLIFIPTRWIPYYSMVTVIILGGVAWSAGYGKMHKNLYALLGYSLFPLLLYITRIMDLVIGRVISLAWSNHFDMIGSLSFARIFSKEAIMYYELGLYKNMNLIQLSWARGGFVVVLFLLGYGVRHGKDYMKQYFSEKGNQWR
ncbi:Chromosomal replication initiation ATPase DnaA [Natronincola peptidivorans]|uniref:Chromosomal replication initiation ATPase DnaA n=1 Tax=Natronincola peptidivorans TaxID=426128 RepID=A0A1H9ZHL6_9FIRM|nr:tetratricopeptide repeat protein [Natronincola peptidivorans]SES81090.1 Chromosomal replication initiation ATPase DnaA [Natronincola peptidivorans]